MIVSILSLLLVFLVVSMKVQHTHWNGELQIGL